MIKEATREQSEILSCSISLLLLFVPLSIEETIEAKGNVSIILFQTTPAVICSVEKDCGSGIELV